jgi:DNA-binding MarR family transcriptional regulator
VYRYDEAVSLVPPIDPEVLQHPLLTTMGLLMEAQAGLVKTFERGLADQGAVTGQTFEILLRLARSPAQQLRMTDLAGQTALSASGLTRAVDRLERDGLVRRDSCATDGRVSYAVLTEAGRARMAHALPHHVAQITDVLGAALTPAELDELTTLMRRLRDAVNPEAACASEPEPPPTL